VNTPPRNFKIFEGKQTFVNNLQLHILHNIIE
jgi:hypothetical protein